MGARRDKGRRLSVLAIIEIDTLPVRAVWLSSSVRRLAASERRSDSNLGTIPEGFEDETETSWLMIHAVDKSKILQQFLWRFQIVIR